MAKAITLAEKTLDQTEPNPAVGALLVSAAGELLGEGWHERAGAPHAEVKALEAFDQVPEGATLYVTLEPCNHQGRTPPCTQLLLQKKVRRLVVGCLDPNPKMQGQSLAYLKAQGLEVVSGVLAPACTSLNRVFNKHITTGLPYVTAKAAVTLDGKIATALGQSQWITGPEARAFGHRLRSQHQGILVGRKTLNQDNPRLTDRCSPHPRQPAQVVFASTGAFAYGLHFLDPQPQRRFVVVGNQAGKARLEALEAQGILVLVADQAVPDPKWALQQLYRQGLVSLLLEGGAGLWAGFLGQNLIDRICLFVAPKIMGQPAAPGFAGDLGALGLAQLPSFHFGPTRVLGSDLLLELFQRKEDVYRLD
ncbi:MAG: riboflavin biosynthesis protein RibD [Candidatus Lambdaproteobacteria bacterium RIFOXYD1_FULL_56_27]|uniref:Riboflavin biosynthesis protein RibD n=1 Tax=Candidatus Lambdaproteobacteria bacterium RIFOXYD2_FULL_56_26 TaxID=1817773 RepID=A0A1F6H3W7_9PROT|nr:MAG: riboflavin biosynthesis protein RibD [Candidatus Lambdaproteobacteria bacterium RIFOXYC1_FULL_56_13]OGH05067.1 MAG: riboflavin biosynthesis protein RibD [Candidatus Lambdaproteobacteria bacterium RIFOXYD2_FULL_56_26]OGH09532.1 MAG: riboflavin biosynthesis protein RibD [Candidatus Lambdaproteobacteria bacterium RIFOXYD1_FULL_56_27]